MHAYVQNNSLRLPAFSTATIKAQQTTVSKTERAVDSVLRLMTLDEKIGQMNQYNGPWSATGPLTNDGDLLGRSDQARLVPC
jgi:beta-glucosidase